MVLPMTRSTRDRDDVFRQDFLILELIFPKLWNRCNKRLFGLFRCTHLSRAIMMDAAEVVIPRKIGACAATRAVVLLYTDAGGTKIRKRIMPNRTLGWLGVAT